MATGAQPGASQRRPEFFRIMDGILTLKDWSELPADNRDRVKKLGHQQGTRIGVVVDFDEDDYGRTLQDGLHDKFKDDATFYLEPDNLIFRPHKNGGDEDQVWALRMISDMRNVHNKKENRSTHIVDQRNSQRHGSLHDLVWIKYVLDTVSEKERVMGPNGECSLIGKKSAGTPSAASLYTAVLNIFIKAGYLTDSENIGQFKHAFKILPFTRDIPTGTIRVADDESGDGNVQSTAINATPELVNGQTNNSDGDWFGETCLWSDIIFYQNKNRWGPLGIDEKDDKNPSGVLCYGGLLWSGRSSTNVSDQEFPDKITVDGDKASAIHANKFEFPRKNRYNWIRPWIRAPRPSVRTGTYSPPTGVPGSDPVPTGETTPGTPTVGATSPLTLDFKPGRTTGISIRGGITESLDAHKIGWQIRYTVDVAKSLGNQIVIFLGYRIFKDGEAANAAPVFLRDAIPYADIPAPNQRKSYVFEIPVGAIEPGDTVEVSLWRSNGDSYPGRFKVLEHDGILGLNAPTGQGGSVWP